MTSFDAETDLKPIIIIIIIIAERSLELQTKESKLQTASKIDSTSRLKLR